MLEEIASHTAVLNSIASNAKHECGSWLIRVEAADVDAAEVPPVRFFLRCAAVSAHPEYQIYAGALMKP